MSPLADRAASTATVTIAPMVQKPRILLVEDEPGIADTLQYVLATDGFLPVWCSTAEDALRQFAGELPALVVLDVGLPDLNGFELFKRLQALPGGAQVPMLFLTARSDEIDRVVGLELGADDYIAKPFSPRELVARVRGILRRSVRSGTSLGPAGSADSASSASASTATQPSAAPPPFALDEERHQIRFYGRLLDLSRYEYGVLRLLVQRPGRVFTRDELLAKVWDDHSDSFDRTVDAHIKTLRAKLKAAAPASAPDIEPIRTLRGTGYALSEDLPESLA
jgi:two-component system, OmpR family, catabolic regulation response regulator CreB